MAYITLQQNISASITETQMLALREILSFEIVSDGHQSWEEVAWKNEEATIKFQMNEVILAVVEEGSAKKSRKFLGKK
ncbi:hypothetical protein FRX31_034348 [Thalictrum thalictroides]|uniref:Uncharacterized protein n=1 Tax=Thalictrum thalictroides TaxID=46969 RepID=A0A7J6UU20_THATH|nr:hypothetical protein FRX31_034348 [Thalictrum thalictroides]